jgi:4-diphosphocytidyl-2-C-methyl-D-erythritol kinase
VLVYPGFGVSTKEAYARVKLPFQNGIPGALRLPTKGKIGGPRWAKFLFNRFEEFVFPGHPELPRLKEILLAEGAAATLMSGSGSSIFGIVNSPAEGKKILSRLRKRYNQSWLVHTA